MVKTACATWPDGLEKHQDLIVALLAINSVPITKVYTSKKNCEFLRNVLKSAQIDIDAIDIDALRAGGAEVVFGQHKNGLWSHVEKVLDTEKIKSRTAKDYRTRAIKLQLEKEGQPTGRLLRDQSSTSPRIHKTIRKKRAAHNTLDDVFRFMGMMQSQVSVTLESIKNTFVARHDFTAAISVINSALGKSDGTVGALQKALGTSDRTVGRLQKALEASDKTVGRLQKALEACDKTVGRLQKALEASDKTIRRHEREMKVHDLDTKRALTSLQKEVDELRSKCVEMADGCQETRAVALRGEQAAVTLMKMR